MLPAMEESRLEDLSDIRVKYFLGKHAGATYDKTVLMLSFRGTYRIGSAGWTDANYIAAMGSAGLAAFDPHAVIIDFREVDYQWGDDLGGVLPIVPRHDGPSALVVGDACRTAIASLYVDVEAERDAWIFDTVEDAWRDITSRFDEADRDNTPLIHAAAKAGDLVQLKGLLESGESPDRYDRQRNTPLHVAATAETTKVLLAAGSDANVKNRNGQTPLHRSRFLAQVQLLLEAGADPDARTTWGECPLCGVAGVDSVAITKLLLESGADVHQRRRKSLLHRRGCTAEVGELYIEAGIDRNLKDDHGRTPLDSAEEWLAELQQQADWSGWEEGLTAAFECTKEFTSMLRRHGAKRAEELD